MKLARLRLPIPVKLLLVSSLLLLLPWLGLRYLRELERLLLAAQDQGLAATARAVATTLNDRPALMLSGEVYPLPDARGPQLRVPNLAAPITVDGRTDDWKQPGVVENEVTAWTSADAPSFSYRYRVGRHGGGVYAVFEVEDASVVTRDPERPELADDQLQVAVVTPQDELLRFALDAAGDGPAQCWLVRGDGSRQPDARIEGAWRTTAGGYVVEVRLPRSLVGPRLAFAIADVDDPASRALVGVHGTAGTGSREDLATVVVPSPEISELIRGLGRARSRIWVVDAAGRVLAQAGTLRPAAAAEPLAPTGWERLALWLRPLTRRLLTPPREDFDDVEPGTYRLAGPEVDAALAGRETRRTRRTRDGLAEVVSVAHPVYVEDRVAGAVVVEETTNEVIAGRNRGFETLFAGLLAVSATGAAALLLFATRLSWRIGRLRDDVERAVDPRGRVTGTVRGTAVGDELGDLARSFAAILEELRQHTSYLEQVGRRLSHELRTPIGVVRSSLDNLALAELPGDARVYIERAEEGLRRLGTILARMSEASRLEEVLRATERETFDLGRVVAGCVSGYRLANPGRTIELRVPAEPLPVAGAPDLVAQLLDKLVDNALGFARPGTPVVVSLARHGRAVALSVSNSGPRLPAEMEGRLFESMVSVRAPGAGGGEPHLGFGLAIVRLIAEFHGGSAAAHDRPDGDGVIVTVTLPLLVAPAPTA